MARLQKPQEPPWPVMNPLAQGPAGLKLLLKVVGSPPPDRRPRHCCCMTRPERTMPPPRLPMPGAALSCSAWMQLLLTW